jgi:hypothetical protein
MQGWQYGLSKRLVSAHSHGLDTMKWRNVAGLGKVIFLREELKDFHKKQTRFSASPFIAVIFTQWQFFLDRMTLPTIPLNVLTKALVVTAP